MLENCVFYISRMYEFLHSQGQYQSFGDVRLNVRFARKRTRLGDLWARRYRVEAEGLGLPFWPITGLGQNEEPGGFGGEARRRRRLEQRTEMTTTRTHFTFRVAMLPPRPPKPPPPRPPKPPPPPPRRIADRRPPLQTNWKSCPRSLALRVPTSLQTKCFLRSLGEVFGLDMSIAPTIYGLGHPSRS